MIINKCYGKILNLHKNSVFPTKKMLKVNDWKHTEFHNVGLEATSVHCTWFGFI